MRLLTNSEARCYRECPRKHRIKYVEGYRPLAEPGPLFFGTLAHTALAQIWQGQPAAFVAGDADPFDLVRLEEMLRGYVARWGQPENVQAVEVEFRAPLRNPETGAASRTFELAGKLDAIQLPLLVEHKTSGSDISPGSDYWRQLRLDQQISTYFVGAETLGYDCTACMYDVLGKPKLRPYTANKRRKADETPEEYRERVRAELSANPDRYSRNPDACFKWGRGCEYFDVCTGCAALDDEFLFRKTTTPHEELQEVA
jgi:hypothetical protein